MATETKMRFSEFVDLLLATLYRQEEQTPGTGPGQYIDLNALSRQFKEPVPFQWVFDAAKVLESRALVRCMFTMRGVLAQLTGEGRLYVEEDHGTGIIKQFKELPQNFVVVSGTGNQVVVGGNQTEVHQSIEQERQPAFELLDEISKQLKQDATLTSQEKEDLLSDVDMIRGQLKRREPNRPALAALLEPLSKVASIAGFVLNLIKLLNA
jgi:hypothetical protein